ncbi:MAG TPA: HD-GYP domain-containing protein [Solirubrobacteraceae bacterium]|nr:HD-GYP domain-containing protein [Solirubrobacteraceae bacterium]
MSFTPDLAQQERLAAASGRTRREMTAGEWRAEELMSGAFVLAVAAIWYVRPPHSFAVLPALLCVALLVLATRVRFSTPFGFTVATQLAFVPLLFAMPAAWVPIAVVVALSLAAIPEVVTGKARADRLVKRIGNAWFAIGPAAVFAATGTAPMHADGWLLLAALGAQFAADFGASAVRYAIAGHASLAEQAGDAWVYVIDAALSGVALVVAEEIHRAGYAPLALLPLLGLLAVFARDRNTRLTQLIELNNAYRGTAMVLGNVVEADDGYTGEHSRSVVALCLDVADRLGLSEEQKRNLEFGALLHDVGKIAIPKEIINKPGELSAEEWVIIKTHTLEGQKLLDTVGGFMRDVGVIVRAHHERWDGKGYPDGLAGEAIPLESRIVACCDTWNAMRTTRSYRTMLSFEAAEAEMERVAGSQLDPRIVAALLEAVRSEPRGDGEGQAAAT